MFEKFKRIFNKTDFDYSSGYVDPLVYHKTFYFFLKAFRVTDVDRSKNKCFDPNVFLFAVGVVANILVLISLSYALSEMDIPVIIEDGTLVIVLGYKKLILTCTKINLEQYERLLNALKEDFRYICTTGKKYRKRYFEQQLLTWKISIFTVVFTSFVPISMNLSVFGALIYYFLTHEPGDSKNRPLMFPFYVPGVDFSKTPVYEIAFTFSVFCCFVYAYTYIFMIQTQIVWVRHIASKADVVIWNIQDLLKDIHPPETEEQRDYFINLIKYRMRVIVKWHQSMYSLMDDYTQVYKKLLLYEQIFCGPVICLTAYCTAEKLEEGVLNGVALTLGFATFVLYYLPSHLCTFLTFKVQSICDACWDTPFWNADKVIRPYMVLIMQRSLRPPALRSAGLKDVSLETFSNKMASAYSCFNMLRQANR